MRPHCSTVIDANLHKMIAAHLVTNYAGSRSPTVLQMKKYVPVRMEEWKKLKILDRDEMIRTADCHDKTCTFARDNTFIKVSRPKHYSCISLTPLQYRVQIDKNANKRNASVVLVWNEYYGHLIRILSFSLLADCQYQVDDGTTTPRIHVVVVIAPVPRPVTANELGMQFYKGDRLKSAKVLDLSCIQCVVGWIRDHDQWALIDRGTIAPLLETREEEEENSGE
jgi:hypothetical protein